jgi:hypothetical protein
MSLPSEVRQHHTIWVDVPDGRNTGIRYAVDGDRVVCFGDDGLSGAVDGTRLTADVRGLASGPPDASFWVRVKDLAPEDVSVALLSDIVGHRPLGRSADEVVGNLEVMRHSRRLVALEG